MAPILFALALFAQDASPAEAPSDAPVATQVPRKQTVAPLPIQGGAVSAPSDDYGYVGWCYGSMAAYVDLYDLAMPEVTRIERAWPTPSTEENLAKVYPEQRDEAVRNMALFRKAMEAAEKASPTPIQTQGAGAIARGRAVWTGATSVPRAQLAQFWMTWSPPAKCEETAKTLQARSALFGQALSYNAKGATIIVPPPPVDEPAPAMMLASPQATPTAPLAAPEPEPAAPDAVAGPSMVQVETAEAGGGADVSLTPAAEPVPVEVADSQGEPAAPIAEGATVTGDGAMPKAEEPPAPSAIDALLPAGEPQPEAAPAPTPAPAAPSAKKRKRGLKETLTGMRGPQ